MEFGMPFDFDPTAPDPEEYEYNATEERMVRAAEITNGVFPQVRMVKDNILEPEAYLGQSLYTYPGDGLSVVVSPGVAMVEGTYYVNTAPLPIPFEENNVEQVFDIVVEVDLVNSKVHSKKQYRTPGASLENALNRSEFIYQLCIATVTIPANAKELRPIHIIDQRLNTALATVDGKPICGLVGSAMQADTRMIFEQFQQQLTANQNYFATWFQTIQDVLDGDVAGNLANQITTHTTNQEVHTTPEQKNYILTHGKIGTVHNLSGVPTGTTSMVNGIFQAVGDFTEGDTFNVDGVPYAAKLQTGEALEEGTFKLGSLVAAVLDCEGKTLGFKAGSGGSLKFLITASPTEPETKKMGLIWIKGDRSLLPTKVILTTEVPTVIVPKSIVLLAGEGENSIRFLDAKRHSIIQNIKNADLYDAAGVEQSPEIRIWDGGKWIEFNCYREIVFYDQVGQNQNVPVTGGWAVLKGGAYALPTPGFYSDGSMYNRQGGGLYDVTVGNKKLVSFEGLPKLRIKVSCEKTNYAVAMFSILNNGTSVWSTTSGTVDTEIDVSNYTGNIQFSMLVSISDRAVNYHAKVTVYKLIAHN